MHRKHHNEKARKHEARQSRVRSSMKGSAAVRLTIYRSARHIYAQLDDPSSGKTLGMVSTRSQSLAGDGTGNIEAAKRVGKAVADLAREKQIERVVFNRNGFLFHGRIKALADAAREAGLQF